MSLGWCSALQNRHLACCDCIVYAPSLYGAHMIYCSAFSHDFESSVTPCYFLGWDNLFWLGLLVGDDEGDGNVLSTSFSCNRDDHNNAVLFTMVRDNESSELIEKSRHEIIPIFLLVAELKCRPWSSPL